MDLFKVSFDGDIGDIYVVSSDPTAAYNAACDWLNRKDWGFPSHRSLGCVELVASANFNPGKLLVVDSKCFGRVDK